MIAQENDTTLEEALRRSSRALERKIEYSVNLLRRAERIALSYDNKGGVFPCVQRRKGQPSPISHCEVGRSKIYGAHEPDKRRPARGYPFRAKRIS